MFTDVSSAPTAAELWLRQEDAVLLLLKWPSPEFCSMCTLGRQGTSPPTVGQRTLPLSSPRPEGGLLLWEVLHEMHPWRR